jgi:hypothetical protein
LIRWTTEAHFINVSCTPCAVSFPTTVSRTIVRTGVGRRPRRAAVLLRTTARGCSNSASTTAGSVYHRCRYDWPISVSHFHLHHQLHSTCRHAAWSGQGASANNAQDSATEGTIWRSVVLCRRTVTAHSEPGVAGSRRGGERSKLRRGTRIAHLHGLGILNAKLRPTLGACRQRRQSIVRSKAPWLCK